MLTRLRVTNFKSFTKLDLDFSPLSVFVGANAAGKSNLIDAFRFVQETVREGLAPPVERRYGWKGIKCRKAYAEEISFGFRGNLRGRAIHPQVSEGGRETPFAYSFAFKKLGDGFVVTHEEAESPILDRKRASSPQELVTIFRRESDRARLFFTPFSSRKKESDITELEKDHLLLGYRLFSTQTSELTRYIEGWRFYAIDPEKARGSLRVREVQELSESGDDLALLLWTLQKDSSKRAVVARSRITSLMGTLVPGFEEWKVRVEGGQAYLSVKEKKTKLPFQPGLVSDGTIRLLAFLASLTYHRRVPSLVCIEEPERSLHPWVMKGLVEFLREVSTIVQVIVTTHSPYIVRHCRPEEVFLVDKGAGRSRVRRATSVRKITEYAEEFTLDELWLQNYLEGGVP